MFQYLAILMQNKYNLGVGAFFTEKNTFEELRSVFHEKGLDDFVALFFFEVNFMILTPSFNSLVALNISVGSTTMTSGAISILDCCDGCSRCHGWCCCGGWRSLDL